MTVEYRIANDELDDQSPRDWDNLGTMVCFHRRYNLGDEQPDRIEYWLSGMLSELGLERSTEQWDDFIYDLENGYKESIQKAWSLLDNHIFMLPLYLYDHSGLTMRTTSFSCPWDSGQVGFIYVTKDDVRKEWGKQRISKKLEELIYSNLRAEVETYDQYLTGDVWGYIVTVDDEIVDSCWGFYGYDYCEEEAKMVAKYYQDIESEQLIDLQSNVRELA
jgi:hypothetical protein